MNLWIRSQDKENLVKVDKIELYENNDDRDDEYKTCMIYEYTDSERQYLLGKYKSKKRALEVLDEIQDFITINNSFDLYAKTGNFPLSFTEKYSYTSTYQMPKD